MNVPSVVPQHPSITTAQAVIDGLLLAGVRDVVYCPGSRNAPFAYVLEAYEAADMVRVHPFAEERGGAFWAVGAAKAREGTAPVAVVTTSGTAASEVHPALEEAHHQGLCVVAVTADRPFELIGVGASQATTQTGLFGPTPVATLDVPALQSDGSANLERLACGIEDRTYRCVMRGLGVGGHPGPVHINVALRDPLVPDRPVNPAVGVRSPSTAAPVRVEAATGSTGHHRYPWWDDVVDPLRSTVVIAGDGDSSAMALHRLLAHEAALRGIPIVAEPSSGVTDAATWIPHGPWIVEHLGNHVQQVIVLGKPTLSRPVGRLLAHPDVRVIVVSDRHEWPDLAGNADVVVPGLSAGRPASGVDGGQWLALWRDTAASISATIDGHEDKDALSHVTAARAIWRSPADVDLWLGASGAIRAFDVAASGKGRAQVLSNRGLAGIDGTVASALGFQFLRQRPIRVVMGDLTFCYDLPSLAARPDGDQDIQLVVFDDRGGSIFQSLEHGMATTAAMYRRFFAVPQHIDVCAAAESCGWRSRHVSSLDALIEEVSAPVRGRSVLHVPLNPPADLLSSLHENVRATLSQ